MNAERADYIKIDLSSKNSFGLTFLGDDKNRSLFIEEPENFGAGLPKEPQDLLRTVMLAHLIARHFPKVIETNFKVEAGTFLNEFYKHYGFAKPRIVKGENQVVPSISNERMERKGKVPYVNAHSGGLDSIYRAAKLVSQGKEIMLVHVRNLNPTGTLNEALASRHQAKVFGVPYAEVKLRNGTDNTGFAVMRTRDMLLGLITAMVAEPYGARKVLIEGDMQTDPQAHFSEYAPAWEFFNKLIKESGLNSQVEGMDAHDIETIGEVLKLEEKLGIDILPLVQNCFTPGYQIRNNRKKWERVTPVIAGNSSEHWCGSCAKCRRMTLGRIYYHDPRFAKITSGEVNYFVEDTKKWLNAYPNNRQLTSESFLRHLDALSK